MNAQPEIQNPVPSVGVPAAPRTHRQHGGAKVETAAGNPTQILGTRGGGVAQNHAPASTLQTATGRQALQALAILRTTRDINERARQCFRLQQAILNLDAQAAAHARLCEALTKDGTAELLRTLENMGVVMVATDAEAAPLSEADLLDDEEASDANP